MSTKIAMIRFPGSNCDQDMISAFKNAFNLELKLIDYREKVLGSIDGLILPGGFSYGDALRGGALASLTPILDSVKQHAKKGRPILGVCNGFQILTESHILPGVLVKNESSRFICKNVDLLKSSGDTVFHNFISNQINLPIAHGEGKYFLEQDDLKALEDNGEVFLRYKENPNGSTGDIAGVLCGRTLGMMPHPERAWEKDGNGILKGFLEACV